MNARRVGILAVLAVVAVAAAWWLTSERRTAPVAGVGEPLLPGLGERLERLKEFRLTGGSGAAVTLRREDGGFRVLERHGFPADVGKLRQYLLRLADARRLEPKTANPERHAELGVEDPAKEGAASTLLTLVFEDGDLAVVVGRYNGQGSGTFLRLPGDDQSWLVAGDLTLEREPTRWLARELIDLPSGKVRRLELRRADGETIVAAKKSEQDANFTVENLPAGARAERRVGADRAGRAALGAADRRRAPRRGAAGAGGRARPELRDLRRPPLRHAAVEARRRPAFPQPRGGAAAGRRGLRARRRER
ncbi:MAG: DUF4340 domain-containing protein [Xanthomonadales bacterium]|nr:DUF4340 domain-containing protein [Xanthomonadales bacterium]